MKKIFLLVALVCASQMYGMESAGWKSLPVEVKGLILVALARSGDNLKSAIQYIKQASQVNMELYNTVNDLKGFTTLVQVLANKFNRIPRYIANQFGTETAKRYVALGDALLGASFANEEAQVKINKMIPLLLQGADPSFQSDDWRSGNAPLHDILNTMDINNPEQAVADAKQLVKLLLDYGAVPIGSEGYALDDFKATLKDEMLGQALEDKINEIKQMLESARNK